MLLWWVSLQLCLWHAEDPTADCQDTLCWLQVREVALEAIERARRGEGPTLIEAQTYRFRGHSLADPDELREKKEKEHWQVQATKMQPMLVKFTCLDGVMAMIAMIDSCGFPK